MMRPQAPNPPTDASAINRLNAANARLMLGLFSACVALFGVYPQLDLVVSQWFYQPDGRFVLGQLPVITLIYSVFAKIHYGYLLILILLLALPSLRLQLARRWQRPINRKPLVFLLLVLLAGPGLIVNIVLKDNSTSRARPSQIADFGGHKSFTPAFTVTDQCHHNCSFVSGHAAAGFYLIALSWVWPGRRWFLIGTLTGFGVGLCRIIQGGHFLSDVVFSFWAVYFTTALLARVYGLRLQSRQWRRSAAA